MPEPDGKALRTIGLCFAAITALTMPTAARAVQIDVAAQAKEATSFMTAQAVTSR